MRKIRTYGSVRGARSNARPYRDSLIVRITPTRQPKVRWQLRPWFVSAKQLASFSVQLRCVPDPGALTLRVEVPPGQWSVGPVAGRRLGRATDPVEALRQRPPWRGRANRRAVTRVKPEQASKGKLWTPTRPKFGEGSTVWGSSRQTPPNRSTGVLGTARRDRGVGKRGRPVLDGGSGLNSAFRRWSARESDRVIAADARQPGNPHGCGARHAWRAAPAHVPQSERNVVSLP